MQPTSAGYSKKKEIQAVACNLHKEVTKNRREKKTQAVASNLNTISVLEEKGREKVEKQKVQAVADNEGTEEEKKPIPFLLFVYALRPYSDIGGGGGDTCRSHELTLATTYSSLLRLYISKKIRMCVFVCVCVCVCVCVY